jgi:HSP20 family molecular chaperone IbpA
MIAQTLDGTPKPQRSRLRWVLDFVTTGPRDRLMNAILASPSVRASTQSASFGMFSPLAIQGLQLNSANNHIDIRVDEIILAERSPWQLLPSALDLGTIQVKNPHVRLELPLDVKIESSMRLEPTFTAVVTNAALTVRVPGLAEPVIDVDGIDMTFRVEKAEEGRLLTLDPFVVFDRRKISPQLSNHLLQLIDPSLGEATQISGEVSLSLDSFRIPIGIPTDQMAQRLKIEGRLGLHHVCTERRSPMRQALVQLVADLNGKNASDVVRLVQDAEIRFHAEDGRLHHEGLRIGLPDIDPDLVITSHGSVGLDQTLDVHVELPRLDPILRNEKGPAKCHITGTIGNPKVSVQDASLVLRQPDHQEPIINVQGLNLNMQVENTDSGYVLAVEPVEILKNAKLSAGLAAGLVRLIVPDLAGDRQVTGDMSLSFATLRIPLGVAKEYMARRLVAAGKLSLHQVAFEAINPLMQALIKVLANLYGKPPSNLVRLIEDAEINFQMRDGRLYHDGLRLGFPEIDPELVVSSRGWIGLDETLDLHLDLPCLLKAHGLDQGPTRCHLTGTIRDPKISLLTGPPVVESGLPGQSEAVGQAGSFGEGTRPMPVHSPDKLNHCKNGGTPMANSIPWRSRIAGLAEKAPMLNHMRDRLFDNFRSLWQGAEKSWPWGMDVEETKEAILVKAEAPGFEPGEFDLQIQGNELVLKASKKIETKDQDGKVKEVRHQECRQSVKLPLGINQEMVNATYHNGILTVTLLKATEANGIKIPVKSV